MSQYKECSKCGSLIDSEAKECKFCKTKVSLPDKINNSGEETKMGFFSNYKAKKAKEQAEEAARQKVILSGKIKPIKTNYNLDPGEKAYITFQAHKKGVINRTVSSTHQVGVASRAGCGCCLLGPLGALLGGVTAPSQTNQNTVESTAVLDSGTMIFTNKRFLFVGNKSMTSLEYKKALDISFKKTLLESKLEVKYPEMVNGEYYSLSGTDSKIAEIWFQGIRK